MLLPFSFKPASILIIDWKKELSRRLQQFPFMDWAQLVKLHQHGLSQTKISQQTGVSGCAVQALFKKHKETGNVPSKSEDVQQGHQLVWQKPVRPRNTYLLSGEVWPEVVFMESCSQKPYLQCENKAKQIKFGQRNGVQKQFVCQRTGRGGTIMSVCRQQWSPVDFSLECFKLHFCKWS